MHLFVLVGAILAGDAGPPHHRRALRQQLGPRRFRVVVGMAGIHRVLDQTELPFAVGEQAGALVKLAVTPQEPPAAVAKAHQAEVRAERGGGGSGGT